MIGWQLHSMPSLFWHGVVFDRVWRSDLCTIGCVLYGQDISDYVDFELWLDYLDGSIGAGKEC